jgi:hypothetical protein
MPCKRKIMLADQPTLRFLHDCPLDFRLQQSNSR